MTTLESWPRGKRVRAEAKVHLNKATLSMEAQTDIEDAVFNFESMFVLVALGLPIPMPLSPIHGVPLLAPPSAPKEALGWLQDSTFWPRQILVAMDMDGP